MKLNHGDAQITYQHPQALQVERIYIRKSFKRLGRQTFDYESN